MLGFPGGSWLAVKIWVQIKALYCNGLHVHFVVWI